MAEALNVKVREARGKRESRRLRRAGAIPAVLYGHGEANVSLAISTDEMAMVLRRGGRVVELKGALQEKALIRDLQWNTFGTDVLHVDFARVSEHERVEVKVKVELRGQSPGAKDGGIVELLVHELEIECEALSIPERLEVSVKELHIGQSITAGQVPLPAGAKLLSDPEVIAVHCIEAKKEEEEVTAEAGVVEPEIIGRKPDEEEEAEE